MKQAIALTSACAIILMPVQSAAAADTNAVVPHSQSSPIEVVSTPSSGSVQKAASARAAVELSSDPTAALQSSQATTPSPPSPPVVAPSSTSAIGSPGAAEPVVAPEIPSATISPAPGALSLPPSQATPSAGGIAPAAITSNVPVPSDKAEIVSALPEKTLKELQEQVRTPGMIASHGEQPISEGPEQCVSAGQCGNRNAIGFSMLAWGAALAGLIGLIVWIGKAGPDRCCGSDSSCCP